MVPDIIEFYIIHMFQHPHKSFAQVPLAPTACWSSVKLPPQHPVEQRFNEPLSRNKDNKAKPQRMCETCSTNGMKSKYWCPVSKVRSCFKSCFKKISHC